MQFYTRITEALEDKGYLIPVEDYEKTLNEGFVSEHDQYASVYMYNQKQFEQFEKSGTIKGIKDVVTNKLVFDFDNKEDQELARKDATKLLAVLGSQGIKDDNLELYWSGYKGFTVIVHLDRTITPEMHSSLALDFFGKSLSTLDKNVYNASRILRVPNSKHPVSNLYKVKITPNQLKTMNVEGIKKLAAVPGGYKKSPPVKLKDELFIVKSPVKEKKEVAVVDLSTVKTTKPKHWKLYKWALVNAVAVKPGERHSSMMVIAATCRGYSYTRDITEGFLNQFDEKYAANTKQEENPTEVKATLDSVFSENWQGGQYNIENNPWLRDYAQRIGIKDAEDVREKVINIAGIEDGFTHYVKNIEANTITVGIPALDNAVPITTGMNLAIVGAPSSGKCLGKNTPVMMFDGTIKMVQDIKKGDLLMGDDSTPRKVLSTCVGREKMYRVEQQNGNDYVVNESHILSLRSNYNAPKNKNIRKGNVIDINVLDFNNSSSRMKKYYKGFKVPVQFETKNQKLDPYFLGLWLGDGDSNTQRITNIDKPILEYFDKYAKTLGYTTSVQFHRNVETTTIVGIKRKNLIRTELQKLNLIKNKHIPSDYLRGDRNQRLSLLAGIIDSDGYWSSSNHYEVTFKNTKLANDLVYLCRSLGFKTTITLEKKGCWYKGEYKEGTYNRVYFYGKGIKDIPVLLERKKATQEPSREVLNTKINIVPLEVDNYYGFEIDGNHRFLLGDFTVTHNTALALEILKNTSERNVISVFVSLDMHRNRLFTKLIMKVTGYDLATIYEKFKNGDKDEIMAKLKKEYGNVWFYDRSAATVDKIRDYIDEVEEITGKKVKLVMLDYFERVNSERSEETAASKDIAGKLQDLVADKDIAMITLVQPNKSSISGGADQPILNYSAIKGSSFLSQSFRSIISIWRPFFNPEWKAHDKFMQMAILKNDLGELDVLNFTWNGRKGEIKECTNEQIDEMNEMISKKKQQEAAAKSGSAWD